MARVASVASYSGPAMDSVMNTGALLSGYRGVGWQPSSAARSQYSILNNISSTKQHSLRVQLASEKSLFVSIKALKCSVLRGSSLLQVQMLGAVPRVELQRYISDGVMGQFSFSRPALTIHISKYYTFWRKICCQREIIITQFPPC